MRTVWGEYKTCPSCGAKTGEACRDKNRLLDWPHLLRDKKS